MFMLSTKKNVIKKTNTLTNENNVYIKYNLNIWPAVKLEMEKCSILYSHIIDFISVAYT